MSGMRHGWHELDAMSNFSFLEGASHPEEMVSRAVALGYSSLGIADRCTAAGVVRAHVAAAREGLALRIGVRLDLHIGDAPHAGGGRWAGACDDAQHADGSCSVVALPQSLEVIVYPCDVAAWGRLCALVTDGRMRTACSAASPWRAGAPAHAEAGAPDAGHAEAPAARLGRGEWFLPVHALCASSAGLVAIVVPPPGAMVMHHRVHEALLGLREAFGRARISLAVRRVGEPEEPLRCRLVRTLAHACDVPMVAVGGACFHEHSRKRLHDVLVAIRQRCTVDAAGFGLLPNARRHLAPVEHLRRRFADMPEAIARAAEVSEMAAGFSLSQLRYRYPSEVVPGGQSAPQRLRALVAEGARERWPEGTPAHVQRTIDHELAIIADLAYEPYFLTVHDIVRFARERGILCQGRGAAANSAVCYCLGITAVDPARIDTLFERFVSRERDEPPDIDVDFEHERREEVIQYIYARYGRRRAAICAEVVCWRGRLALREVAGALGMPRELAARIASTVSWWHGGAPDAHAVREIGMDPADSQVRELFALAGTLCGFPRHLSQHVGGFIITEGPLTDMVPVRDASMDGRTIIEWDKDDVDAMGMMKVDVLALGMLTAVRKAIDLVNATAAHAAQPITFRTIPAEDPAAYDMACRADTVGVFQIESRAQMSMLPRLKPRCFYDLVIEVAIVRPGPIQGDMVHPYLRRRAGEPVPEWPSDAVRRILERTLGVPLFQEQAMALAVAAAGFTPGEADALRRAIAAWKRSGNQIAAFGERLEQGMVERGYTRAFAQQVFTQIQGFSGYGFPESHAASFAHIVYASLWLKCHHPAAFCAALLNSQPMGFYAPAQLVQDAQRHGVEVRPACINASDWDCTLEPGSGGAGAAEPPAGTGSRGPVIRLGLRMVRGLQRTDADALVASRRAGGAFADVADLHWRSGLQPGALRRLAAADAFAGCGIDRQQALWQVKALRGGSADAPLFLQQQHALHLRRHIDGQCGDAPLPALGARDHVRSDYWTTGLSLRAHPLSFARAMLAPLGVLPCSAVTDEAALPHGSRAAIAGLVLVRQRPPTAKGIMFMTVEDETGPANLIVRPQVYEAHRMVARHAPAVIAHGTVERRHGVTHLVVRRLERLRERAFAQAVRSG
jgi:error-prone DNA polymerase